MGRGFVLCSLADGSCSQYFRKLPEGSRQGSKRISFLFFKKNFWMFFGELGGKRLLRHGGEA